jgi:hypothetical protein
VAEAVAPSIASLEVAAVVEVVAVMATNQITLLRSSVTESPFS